MNLTRITYDQTLFHFEFFTLLSRIQALIFNFQKTTAYGGLQALKYTAGGAELETRWRQETAFQKMLLYEEIETGLASL